MITRLAVLCLLFGTVTQIAGTEIVEADVCIYGTTPAGIVAATAPKQKGCSVVLVESSRWVGGVLGAGIKPMQDCREPRAVGGLTKSRVFSTGSDPPTVRQSLSKWLREKKLPVVFEHRRTHVEKQGSRLTSLHLEFAPPDELGVPAPAAKP